MPHYDYECIKCGHIFEVFQKITEEHLKNCPKCKGPIKRLIGSGASIIFKGNGFYTTDYKKKAPTCENKTNAKPACNCCPSGKKAEA
jgi:putative FmdB family regulatory protein